MNKVDGIHLTLRFIKTAFNKLILVLSTTVIYKIIS